MQNRSFPSVSRFLVGENLLIFGSLNLKFLKKKKKDFLYCGG